MDPSMKLFEYNDKSLLASIPTMLAFPKVSIKDFSFRNGASYSFIAS